MSRKPRVLPNEAIEIIGARANNLKNVDVKLPLKAVTLLAGVSGSGKSSLLADTLATEANARMKRFLGVSQDHLEEAEPDAFVGPVPAAIHFSQGAFRASRRTTVGTCSGLLATLRELFVRHGVAWAEEVGEPVPQPSADSYAAWLERHYLGLAIVWAVPMRNVRGDGRPAVAALRRLGISSLVVRSETDPPAVQEKGRSIEIDAFRPLDVTVRHVIEAEIARVKVPGRTALEGALMRAFSTGGAVIVELPDAGPVLADLRGDHGHLLDSDRHHVHRGVVRPYAPPSSALLSFNQPSSDRSGACRECQGLGETQGVAEGRLAVHPDRSVHQGALALWTEKNYKYVNIQHETLEGLRGVDGFDPDVPWRDLPPKARQRLLYGGCDVVDRDLRSGRKLGEPRRFPGFVPAILERYRKGTATSARLASFVQEGPCLSCDGDRWSREARALRVGGRSIAELLASPFAELEAACASRGAFYRAVPSTARPLVDQVHHLASSFVAVGLGHLAGERGMLAVSEGESRRLRLAGLLHARGRDLALLLDEPARGLHEEDIGSLVGALRELKRRHTVILNDHRFALAPAVDHVIELGPGAGVDGGRVIRQGVPGAVLDSDGDAPTRTHLKVPVGDPALEVTGAWLHNLRNVSCRIPLGRLVAITGVSGSGKSSFVRGILLPALCAELGDRVMIEGFSTLPGGRWDAFAGAATVREVVAVEQRRPETNRRSLVATFLGVAETLRRAYGGTTEARQVGLRAPDFGLNGGTGRCGTCLGLGEVEDGTGFAPCPTCGGRRFGDRVQAVKLEGLNVAELLDRSVDALASRPPAWAERLVELFKLLSDLELGYLTLGRRLDRMSGGEVQRLRIAERLWRSRAHGLLLILDEPSAGLHPRDTAQMLQVLDRIVGRGENTVLLVEHNLRLIRASDWVIDFGPGGGPAGGRILAQGPPKTLARRATPTGRALSGRRSEAKSEASSVARKRKREIGPKESEASPESARRARAWLKVLLGHEIRLPTDDRNEHDLEGLAVVLDDLAPEAARPHELGGLDQELARLFLAAAERPTIEDQRASLLEAWHHQPDGRLWIAPALTPMQTWGLGIPAGVLRQTNDRLDRLRLDEQRSPAVVSKWRATGQRLLPETESEAGRSIALDDALTLGGGYVELTSSSGSVIATVAGRYLDLEEGWVAPLRLTPPHLCRSHATGRCIACAGRGDVPALALDLLVDPNYPPTADAFLLPPAAAILKGLRRLILRPFFRRLEEEGLWDSAEPFRRSEERQRHLFLYGYWHRPGPGSFLKSPRADSQKVASWLRWDGVFAHVLGELDRSKDRGWAEAVRESLEMRPCLLCQGSGLGPASRLVCRDGRSLHEWILGTTLGELWDALRRTRCESKRERRVRDRVVRGLGAVARSCPEAPLRKLLVEPRLIHKGLKAATTELMRMPIVD